MPREISDLLRTRHSPKNRITASVGVPVCHSMSKPGLLAFCDLRGLTQSPSLGLILCLAEIYGGPGDGVREMTRMDSDCLHEWFQILTQLMPWAFAM